MKSDENETTDTTFWHWLFHGTGAGPGLRRVVNTELMIHVCVGVVLSLGVSVEVSSVALTLFLPLASILIGLTFAWAGNAQAMLQTPEMEELASNHDGGYEEYVFSYQLAISVLLAALISWALAGVGFMGSYIPGFMLEVWGFAEEVYLYTFSSLTLAMCWKVVISTAFMLSYRRKIREARQRRDEREKGNREPKQGA